MQSTFLAKTHYEVLGVSPNATESEIRKVYYLLAKKKHPDKTSDVEEIASFKVINAAYETLSDKEKRAEYDKSIAPKGAERYFQVHQSPHVLDHYAYLNALFKIRENDPEYFKPGKEIKDVNLLWWQLHHASGALNKNIMSLVWIYRKSDEDKRKLALYTINEKKITAVTQVLASEDPEKRALYDLTITTDLSTQPFEMQEFAVCIGGDNGVEKLREHVRQFPLIFTCGGLFALKNANILDKENFEKLIDDDDEFRFHEISSILMHLNKKHLLTQPNFDLLIKHRKYSRIIDRGLSSLFYNNCLTQDTFEDLLSCGSGAGNYGLAISKLNQYGCNNRLNQKVIACLPNRKKLDDKLDKFFRSLKESSLKERQDLYSEIQTLLQWRGHEAFDSLNKGIEEMFAYALFILDESEENDTSKGEAAMLLALELKLELKKFYKALQENEDIDQEQFKEEFLFQLHTMDIPMGEHREKWKVIVANIAFALPLALTVVGLIGLGIYYACTKQLLFSRTNCEVIRDEIETRAKNLQIPSIRV